VLTAKPAWYGSPKEHAKVANWDMTAVKGIFQNPAALSRTVVFAIKSWKPAPIAPITLPAR
jgi:hypothetical protein